ncbi:hypothetical protein ACSFA3_17330 [Variovorax sp. RHLX14]|uniref:hypothetical protein n=1 Tax=Variovorax sp. RHLX14 TaxID=1259731 RepID=UPI003F461EC3
MSSVNTVSGIAAITAVRNPDAAATPLSHQRHESPVFKRASESPVRATSVDRSDESATFQERVQTLFDAKVPPGGQFSRNFEFDVSGVRGKITEAGDGMLYVDFPQRGIGMLIMGGMCSPTGNASARDVAAMQKAVLLGLST